MTVDLRPLTPDRWPDLETVFNAKGCSVARGCWCMFYRLSGKQAHAQGEAQGVDSKQALRRLAAQDPPPGLIGYRGDTPVGWISLGPREDFARLQRSPIRKPVDDKPVWSIVCFVVPSAYRRQGVARELLAGAIAYARARGVTMLEAYPEESGDAPWFGSKAMFDEAGFAEVARRKPARPVVRLCLDTKI